MTRQALIERILRDVYGGIPTDDRDITDGLVNSYINDGIGIAAKTHYKENFVMEGVAYLNNSFYTTFKGLAITEDTGNTGYWKCTLPQIPFGLGRNEGIKSVKILSGLQNSNISYPVILLTADQWEYHIYLPNPNGVLAKNEGNTLYLKLDAGIVFYQTTATVVMVSGGDATDVASTMNVPDDWIDTIQKYVVGVLAFERAQRRDNTNDGADNA